MFWTFLDSPSQLATRTSQPALLNALLNSQLVPRNPLSATRSAQLATRTSQLATRPSQPALRNALLATRPSATRSPQPSLHCGHIISLRAVNINANRSVVGRSDIISQFDPLPSCRYRYKADGELLNSIPSPHNLTQGPSSKIPYSRVPQNSQVPIQNPLRHPSP